VIVDDLERSSGIGVPQWLLHADAGLRQEKELS